MIQCNLNKFTLRDKFLINASAVRLYTITVLLKKKVPYT